jgi:hypothetical protein
VIWVPPEHVIRTVDVLRSCGRGRRECVVYWVAAVGAEPADVIAVVHPDHTAAIDGYVVDGAWLTNFFFGLADQGRQAVAQVHSHPGAFLEHSWIDDEFVLVPSPGFVSIVVPDLALGPVDVAAWNVQVLRRSGTWAGDPEIVRW